MGYVEPGHGYKGKQRLLCSDEYLHAKYSVYSGKEILMWCFLPGERSHRLQPSGQFGTLSSKHSKIV